MATISLGMIVRNEGKTLKQTLASVAPFVDQIVIGLAGESTDNTRDIILDFNKVPENRPIEYFDIEWNDDFAEARNLVLERCTGDYFLWVDGDDVLVGGDKLRGYIDQYPNVDAFYMAYDYARDENGYNTCYLIRERLVRNLPGAWKWVGKVHEVLLPQAGFSPMSMQLPDVVVRHFKPAGKHDPDRNIKILYEQLAAGEPNPDPRVLVYLGAENAGRGNLTEAIVHWQRFIKLSGHPEEVYQTHVKLSNAFRSLGQIEKALRAAFDGIAVLPDWPDAYYALAKAYASEPLNNYRAAIEWIKVGSSKPKPDTVLIINPLEYTYEPSLLLAICYTHLGDYEMALLNYEQSFQIKQDPKVYDQIRLLKKEVELQKVVNSFLNLREHLGRHDEWLKVRQLYDVVPKLISNRPEILETWERSMQQTAHVLEPQIMVDFYRNNPHWTPMGDDQIQDPSWLSYPRLAFALSVANRVGAKTIVDWGCSDGFISLPLARETGAQVDGYDLDPRCINLAQVRAEKWGLDAQFALGNVEEVEPWQEKADLAILFEVLEHVNDPEKTLTRLEGTARHVAITTPYLAWENGNLPAWDRAEPKGHLRIFDLKDIEVLLQGRGRIHNLYRQPWGNSGWIFADYEVGAAGKKHVAIFAPGSAEAWGPRKLASEGLGGSETAAIKLAEGLAARGHRAFIYNWNDDPGYFNAVGYRDRSEFNPSVRTDLLVAWRTPEIADLNPNTDRLILWMHDTDAGDRLTEERADKFHAIVVLTEWHKQFILSRYPFLDSSRVVVIPNGVDPARFEDPVERDPKRVIYSSSPDRGLDLILKDIWPTVVSEVPDAELHVYYGWDNFDRFGNLPGYSHLLTFKAEMEKIFLSSRNVVQHGRVPQDVLAREMQKATVWLYPTYFPETYCITAVEAQLAGAIPITNHLAGLQETVRSGIILEGDVHDPEVRKKYAASVINVLKSSKEDREKMHSAAKENAPYISWNTVAQLWDNAFLEANDARH